MILDRINNQTKHNPTNSTESTTIDDEGYEWKKHKDGSDWYRLANSNDTWRKWED